MISIYQRAKESLMSLTFLGLASLALAGAATFAISQMWLLTGGIGVSALMLIISAYASLMSKSDYERLQKEHLIKGALEHLKAAPLHLPHGAHAADAAISFEALNRAYAKTYSSITIKDIEKAETLLIWIYETSKSLEGYSKEIQYLRRGAMGSAEKFKVLRLKNARRKLLRKLKAAEKLMASYTRSEFRKKDPQEKENQKQAEEMLGIRPMSAGKELTHSPRANDTLAPLQLRVLMNSNTPSSNGTLNS